MSAMRKADRRIYVKIGKRKKIWIAGFFRHLRSGVRSRRKRLVSDRLPKREKRKRTAKACGAAGTDSADGDGGRQRFRGNRQPDF